MIEAIVSALGAIKQVTPAILLGVIFVSFGLLFLPEVALQSLALTAFRDSNRPYVGGALLVSISLLVGQLLIFSASSLREILKKFTARREQIGAARKMTEVLHLHQTRRPTWLLTSLTRRILYILGSRMVSLVVWKLRGSSIEQASLVIFRASRSIFSLGREIT
jgi:hypothetical protein